MQGEYVSKGRVVEALFIMQNKQQDLQEYVQSLKKKLTDCFAQKKQLECDVCTKKLNLCKKTEIDRCVFYQNVLPAKIRELDNLSKYLLERIAYFSQDIPVEENVLKADIEKAFLVRDKIDLESSLLADRIQFDKQELALEKKHAQARKKQGMDMSALSIKRLRHDVASLNRSMQTKKVELAKINYTLYKDTSVRAEAF